MGQYEQIKIIFFAEWISTNTQCFQVSEFSQIQNLKQIKQLKKD